MGNNKLEIESVAGDWKGVVYEGEHKGYVREVKIAGHTIEFEKISDSFTLTTSEWDMAKDHYPALLIEAAEWYTPPEETDG